MKSKEELKKIADECYEICDASYDENGAVEFKEYVESYISNTYSELSSDDENTILLILFATIASNNTFVP